MAQVDGEERKGGKSAPTGAWVLPPPQPSRLADPARLLTAAARRHLEDTLRSIERSQGDELWVLLAPEIPTKSATDLAQTIYAEWHLSPTPPRATVLILVDATSRQAVIETGQGVEGPMTTLEVARLIEGAATSMRSGSWPQTIEHLARGVAATCAATRARRKPTAEPTGAEAYGPESDDPAPGPETGANGATSAQNAGRPGSGQWGLLSRVVGGGAAAFLFLIALRQRKRNAELSANVAPRPPRPKYLGPPRIDR